MALAEETQEFWLRKTVSRIARRVGLRPAKPRDVQPYDAELEVAAVRRTVAANFIKGNGIEVGAGSRPFPIPADAHCFYGDVRDKAELAKYFSTNNVTLSGHIDAQTMVGIPLGSLDFVISAHVIEHLYDPLGAIAAAIARLRPGGIFLLVAPEMTKTWDCRRPPTTLYHMIADSKDGGEGTRLQAHIEHARYVHPQMTGQEIPEVEIEPGARATMAAGMDLHVHAWREQDFREMLDYAATLYGFDVVAAIGTTINENLYVLRRI